MEIPLFPPATPADWRAAVEWHLKGAGVGSLERETAGGIVRGPLFTRTDLPEALAPLSSDAPPGARESFPWRLLAPVRDPDLAFANGQLLDDLRGGASGLRICAGEGEVPVTTRADLRRLLEGVHAEFIAISFSPNARSEALAGMVGDMPELAGAKIRLGLDPACHARPNLPPQMKPFTLACRKVHEAGGTEVDELAALAVTLAEAFRRHPDAHELSIIEIAADQDAHLGIAKLRAARRIARRIADAFGAGDAVFEFHAITSLRMMQAKDPWTNMLRVMNAGFGAVVGGADAVLTRPFTDGYGRAMPFAHRIARNMQLLMLEESHLGQVRDAAFGSYWHETVTDRIARAAWARFQELEAAGGVSALPDSYTSAPGKPTVGVELHPMPADVPMPKVRA